jgi:hypothetical protein
MADPEEPRTTDPWGNPLPPEQQPGWAAPTRPAPGPAPDAASETPPAPAWGASPDTPTTPAGGEAEWPTAAGTTSSGGAPPPPPPWEPGQRASAPSTGVVVPNDRLAVGALAAGILGLLCGVAGCGGIVVGPIGIALGLIARGRIRDGAGATRGEGMALAGIVLGSIGLALAIFWLAFLLANPDFLDDFQEQLENGLAATALR